MKTGNSIKRLREKANLTQEELGKKMGKTKQWVSNVENGKTKLDIETLFTLAEKLDCGLMDIIEDDLAEFCDDATDYEFAHDLMRRANDRERSASVNDTYLAAGHQQSDDPAIRKRDSVKILVDLMDEQQLDTLLRYLISPQK